MVNESEVREMLASIETAYPNVNDMDDSTEAIYDTILWLLGERTDGDIRMYFEE